MGVFRVGRNVKLLMMFSGIMITRTRRGTLVPTHSSSTCFMRTDTLQASLVTSLLSSKAGCAQQDKINLLNSARGQQRRQREARGKGISFKR